MTALEAMLDAVADRAVAKLLASLPPPAPARKPLVDQAELATYLNVDVRTIYAMRQKGCPHVFVGDSPRFDIDQVMAWLEKNPRATRRK